MITSDGDTQSTERQLNRTVNKMSLAVGNCVSMEKCFPVIVNRLSRHKMHFKNHLNCVCVLSYLVSLYFITISNVNMHNFENWNKGFQKFQVKGETKSTSADCRSVLSLVPEVTEAL